MTDINEQRRKVEELKRKILEQKKKDSTDQPFDSLLDQFTREEKRQTEEGQKQDEEVQRQSEIESRHLAEEAKRREEESARRKQEEETAQRKQEEGVHHQKEEEKKKRAHSRVAQTIESQPIVPVACLQAYAQALKFAWSDGELSKDENALLIVIRKSMGISDQEHASLEQEAQLEIYLQAIVVALWNQNTFQFQKSFR